MAYMCRYGERECVSCGKCEEKGEERNVCPACKRICEWYYLDSFGEVIGCERCVRTESVREYMFEIFEIKEKECCD